LKKIKRNHGSENPTKNYYLAFPALSSQTSFGSKQTPPAGVESVVDKQKDTESSSVCWSKIMSNMSKSYNGAQGDPQSGTNDDADKIHCVVNKTPTKRRNGKNTSKRLNKPTDVQFNSKNYDVYEGATFSPKKMQMINNSSKKRQRNPYSEYLKDYMLHNIV